MNNLDIYKKTGEQIEEEMCAKYTAITGETLYPSDLVRVLFKIIAYFLFLSGKAINYMHRQSFLQYADENHIHLHGYQKGLERKQPQKSVTTVRFYREVIGEKRTVPFGTKVACGEVVFSTTKTIFFDINDSYVDIPIECIEPGEFSNNIMPGQINKLIDIISYVTKVENVSPTSGGADLEDIESYREAIRTIPESYSCAGPKGAYEYHTRRADTTIRDVFVNSDTPGTVQLYCLNQKGQPLSQEVSNRTLDYLQNGEVRPLGDIVTLHSPTRVDYNLRFDFYIPKSLEVHSASISNDVNRISNEFIIRNQQLGKDLNLDELIVELKKVGVKRIQTTMPYFTQIDKKSYPVGTIQTGDINFGGVEDD